MRDGLAVRALALGSLNVDVDPLIVTGEPGEVVDHLLADLAPLGRSELSSDQIFEPLDSIDIDRQHGWNPT